MSENYNRFDLRQKGQNRELVVCPRGPMEDNLHSLPRRLIELRIEHADLDNLIDRTIDDPAGETSLLPVSNDLYMPETELIEPLTIQPTPPAVAAESGVRAAAVRSTAAPDDRTVVIPRPANLAPKPELSAPGHGVRAAGRGGGSRAPSR